ncbi:hypothetical protein TNCT_206051 [Trichonephila clavata]|uniref:Uncharacterized protein n=1 Tax=Trichonephila clavata TaxID=2740835 RepID=A0A8X6H3Z9_TRICU|nr:hypothetical protein TNCT_206051 [Trichonephila clavata]
MAVAVLICRHAVVMDAAAQVPSVATQVAAHPQAYVVEKSVALKDFNAAAEHAVFRPANVVEVNVALKTKSAVDLLATNGVAKTPRNAAILIKLVVRWLSHLHSPVF